MNLYLKKAYKMKFESKLDCYSISKELNNKYDYKISKERLIYLFKLNKKDTNKKYTDSQLKLIFKMYQNIHSLDKIVCYLNNRFNISLTKNKLRILASRHNVSRDIKDVYTYKKLSYTQEKKLIKEYIDGMSTNELTKKYGYKTKKSITDVLKKHNVPIRSLQECCDLSKSYKEFTMELINSKEKAYYLGLLLTDGYVIDSNYQHLIGLDLTDEDCIEFLSEYINVRYTKYKAKYRNDTEINSQLPRYRLKIYGRKYIKQLERYGIIPNKTFALSEPHLYKEELNYINYIIRGIIDGDGWIRKDGNEFYICSASKPFVMWCETMLKNLGMTNLNIIESKGLYYVRSARKCNIDILKRKIYNKPFGMSRKYNKLDRRSETIIGSC